MTKTTLGVFGCVPAFDRYFRIGFGPAALGGRTPGRISEFYQDKQAQIDDAEVFALDFDTGLPTRRRYSRAKIIDMVFFQEGINRSRQ